MEFDDKEFQVLLNTYKEFLIIVEGKKDMFALQKLGFSNIITIAGMPLYAVAEKVASKTKNCLILTNLDAEGKRLYAILKQELSRHGVQMHNQFRNWLFKNTDLRQIEGLTVFLTNKFICSEYPTACGDWVRKTLCRYSEH